MESALKTVIGGASVELPDAIATTRVRQEERRTVACGAGIGRLAVDEPPTVIAGRTAKRNTVGAEGKEAEKAVVKPAAGRVAWESPAEGLAGLDAA